MKKDRLSLKTDILREIFNIAPQKIREQNLETHYLTKKFHIPGEELRKNIDFLVEIGLIQRFPGVSYKEDKIFEWILTDKGLHYLEKKEGEKNQENINRVIAFTGSIIALVTIYNFIIPNLSFENYPTNLLIIKLVFLFLLFICIGPLAIIVINFWKREVFGR